MVVFGIQSLPPDMGTIDKGDLATPKPQMQKGRSNKSIVWDHFTIMNVGDDCYRACCKQCNKSYAYSIGPKMSGTSHLKRHIDTGMCSVSQVQYNNLPSGLELKNVMTSEPPKKRQRATNGALAIPFSQKRCINDIARMVLLHDYSLDLVEHPGFIEFVQSLQPQFETVSSGAIYDECMAIYSSEKMSLVNLLSEIPGTVSLSLNLWTSDETLGYAVLSGQFIDSHWTLHRRLLNIVMVPYPDSEDAFNHAILSCLSGWGVESKLFALTLDSSFANEAAIGNLRGLLSVKNPHMLNGQFLIGSCYARILCSLALDLINAMNETVQKVRNCVKYVKTSEHNEEKFMEIKLQLQVPSSKNLVIDNCTRWDSTYHMLSAASELKEVFACLDTFDNGYRDVLSLDEWRQIDTLCDYLRCFYEAADIITAQKYSTADKFFAKSLPLPSFDFEERHEEDAKTKDVQQEVLFLSACDDTFADVDIYISDISNHTKSELDLYLEEGLHTEQEDFCILDWWKVNKVRYPTLSKMAADLLSMPLATVPRDSVFDTVSKKVDSFRGPLKPEAIEAFACAKDWLHSAVVKMELIQVS
ncbi:hypothetical protein V2J09_011349 [Rumex salicifolius]